MGNHAQGTAQISKLQLNRMLETNAVPTIWISNRTEGIDPAYLRRFMYVIEFRALGAKQRARVLARHLKDDLLLGAHDITEIAERYDVSPAQLSTAVEAARLVASDARPARRTIERVLESSDRLLRGTARPPTGKFDPSAHTLAGLNASQDLAVLAGRLAGWKPGHGPGLAICLYGPPGTGKSEYVHYLAHVMSRPLIQRRASDIIRPYVGETERLIADAFREAASEDAVLLFDEADSFIRTRERAHNVWEITQVNEFLQQLEAHSGLVVCTTNLWHELDEAALRRFTFKVELRYLMTDQALALFELSFANLLASPLTASERLELRTQLESFNSLAAGDFATVARHQRALQLQSTASELLALLQAEVKAKRTKTQRIGF